MCMRHAINHHRYLEVQHLLKNTAPYIAIQCPRIWRCSARGCGLPWFEAELSAKQKKLGFSEMEQVQFSLIPRGCWIDPWNTVVVPGRLGEMWPVYITMHHYTVHHSTILHIIIHHTSLYIIIYRYIYIYIYTCNAIYIHNYIYT